MSTTPIIHLDVNASFSKSRRSTGNDGTPPTPGDPKDSPTIENMGSYSSYTPSPYAAAVNNQNIANHKINTKYPSHPPVPFRTTYSNSISSFYANRKNSTSVQSQNRKNSTTPGNTPQTQQKPQQKQSKRKLHLDISGTFPYFEEEKQDKKEKDQNNNKKNVQIKIKSNSQNSNNNKKKKRKNVSLKYNDLKENDNDKNEETILLAKYGYIRTKFLAKTLQGQVFLAENINDHDDKKTYVVKKTSKKLHNLGITITKKGKRISVEEDIVSEAALMKRFSASAPPSSFIKYYNFIEDSHNYYLIMENGGTDFFDFIVKCHELISETKLSLNEWRKHCKFMFAQMVQFIRWMHVNMNCCNLDISLENMLIKECATYDQKTKTLKKCYIKFIDFGLSEFFDKKSNPNFICNKFVGKTHYKSPKIYNKVANFRANQSDIWSLGVCLFMMIVGAPPYNKPSDNDITFRYIKFKQIAKLLQEWGRIKYVTNNLHDLLTKMLCFDENKRITMDEIVKHPWIKHYFPNDNKPKPHKHHHQIHHKPQTPPKRHPILKNIHSLSVKIPVSNNINSNSSNKDNNDDNIPVSPSLPVSPSYSQQSVSISYSQSISNRYKNKLNIMLPQTQLPSYSQTISQSQSHTESQNNVTSPYQYVVNRKYSNNRKYSGNGVASPISPYSPYGQRYYQGNITPNTNTPSPNTPTPIIQSNTSKHDYHGCYAQIEENKNKKNKKNNLKKKYIKSPKKYKDKNNKKNNKKNKNKKKSFKTKFKLSLPLFGGNK